MYATLAQMTDLYGADDLSVLTGEEHPSAAFEQRVDAACAQADVEVDGYLVDVAALPLDADRIPAIVRLHACRVAYYHLHRDRPTEKAKADYDTAIRYLERVQSGKASLGLAVAGEVPSDAAGSVGAVLATPGPLAQGADRFLR